MNLTIRRRLTGGIMASLLFLTACGGKPAVEPSNATVSPSTTAPPTATVPYTEIGDHTISQELVDKARLLPEVTPENLPDWHGLEYEVMGDYPDGYLWYGFEKCAFDRQDVKNIADLGFNFARVPLNLKFYFENEDVNQANVSRFRELDDLIGYGMEYGVHICLVVCETYGYSCVQSELDSTLFRNEQQMELFLTFWDTVAKRYADIPSSALSFNILNEPPDWIGEERYCAFALKAAETIRLHTPDRLIISDMLAWGTTPLYGLAGSGIVQSIHCYEPNALHNGYMKSWPGTYPLVNSRVAGENRFTLRGSFPAGTTLRLNDFGMTAGSDIILASDGREYVLFEVPENPVLGEAGCIQIDRDDGGQILYNAFNQDTSVSIEEAASVLEIYLSPSGEEASLDLGNFRLRNPDGTELEINVQFYNGGEVVPASDLSIAADGTLTDHNSPTGYTDRDIGWLRNYLQKYADFAEETNTAILLGEFGVPVTADYDATVNYMDDLLTVADEFGWAWSYYDYKGPFCLVKGTNPDLVRPDAVYEKMGDCEVDSGLYHVFQNHFR